MGRYRYWKSDIMEEKTVSVSLCTSPTQHEITRDLSQASALKPGANAGSVARSETDTI